MRIRMEGFIVMDYTSEYPEARQELATWLEEGKIKRGETIIKGGLRAAEQGLLDLYKGINTGMFWFWSLSGLSWILTAL
jgi:NADPH-dependent curcumin reductase CurA